MNTRKVLSALAVVAAILFAVLILAPTTGWIAREQMARMIVPSSDIWGIDRVAAPIQESSDYRMALASAASAESTTRMARMRALEARFPSTPSVYANTLRFATSGDIRLLRDEEYVIEGQKKPPSPNTPHGAASSPADLSAFDHDAGVGERIDPNNAYFPAMRSIGLFEQRRDDEALAALSRAAHKTEWREYYDDEVQGQISQRENARGRQSAVARTAIFASVLFPHYGKLRGAAGVATDKAMQYEMHGDAAHGAQIRLDIMKIGGFMRARGQTAITNLVGVGIARTALLRPGGAAAPKNPGDDMPPSALDDYCRYLQNTRNGAAIPAIRAEYASETVAKDMINGLVHDPGDPINAWATLGERWIAGGVVLAGVLWMLFFGAVAALAERFAPSAPPGSTGRRQAASVCVGVVIAAALLLPRTPEVWLRDERDLPRLILDAAAAFSVAGVLWMARKSKRVVFLTVRDIALAAVVVFGVGMAVIAQANQLVCSGQLITDLTRYSNSSPHHAEASFTGSILELLAPPAMMALICAIVALIRRKPLAASVSQGFRQAALPAAAVGVLVYSILVLTTVRLEATQNKLLDQMLYNEGPYIAALTHKSWPGVTQWPKSES